VLRNDPARALRARHGLWRQARDVVATWFRLVGHALWRGFVEFYRSDDLTYAASVAYYALLSLFPAFLLAFSLLGQFAVDESRRLAIIQFLLRYFPTHFDFLTQQLDAFRLTRVRIGIGGSIALTWAALGVFSAISSAVNHAWGVEKQRNYLKHQLFSFLMMLAAGLILVVALAAVSAMQLMEASWATDIVLRLPFLSVFETLVVRWATTVMLILVVGLIFYFVPNAKVRFRDVWPGAIVTGLMWRVTLAGFSFYLRDMSRFNLIHGSIAAVVVFLVWVYTCAVVLMYGVEFTAAYARLRRGRSDQAPAAPTPRA
jgi:membrane protein